MTQTWQRLKKEPQYLSNLLIREKVVEAIRQFFKTRNYHEVEVPLLSSGLIPESYLEVFETTLLDRHRKPQPAFLTPSPELFLKKLLVSGFGSCFSLSKSFRNTENLSDTHNPEFTLLEWYRTGASYTDLMSESENLFKFIYSAVIQKSKIQNQKNTAYKIIYQNKTVDLTPPWERITMVEAFKKYADLDLFQILTPEAIVPVAQKKGYTITSTDTWEQIFHQIYLNEVEPNFGRGKPTIIYDFPSQMAALAKKKPDDPRFAERFEVFIAGLELGDAYSELTDWSEQEERFKSETEERKRLGKIEHPYDQDFLEALKIGLPKCAGMALGMDRLVMLFANAKNIQDVLLFPASELWTNGK